MITEAEKKNITKELLGCILKSEKAIYKCFELGFSNKCMEDEDPRVRQLFDTTLRMFKETGTLPSKEMLVRELATEKEDAHFFRNLVNTCRKLAENPNLIEKYIDQLEDYTAIRELADGLSATAARHKENNFSTAAEMQTFVADKLMRVCSTRRGKKVFSTFESCENTVMRLRDSHKPPVTTGFKELDEPMHGGWLPGQLATIVGRPGQGKTTAMLQLAVNAAKDGSKVLFLSAELGVKEINYKQLSLVSSLTYSNLFRGFRKGERKEGYLDEEDMAQLGAATQVYKDFPLHVCDICDYDIDSICNLILEQVNIHGIEIVFIDYFQLLSISTKGGPRMPETAAEFAKVCGKLRVLAKSADVPIVQGAQANRDCEKRKGREKKPQLSDLKATGALEQDSYLVISLFREETYLKEKSERKGIIEMDIIKNRYGPLAPDNEFAFIGSKGCIRSIPKEVEKPSTVDEDGNLKEEPVPQSTGTEDANEAA